MLEIALILLIAVVAVVAVMWRRPEEAAADDDLVDLPCPWCKAQTREDDTVCPGCHQPFGALSP